MNMFASFEEKGKIFTQVVTKEPIDVIIRTASSVIYGRVHVRPEDRLKDELDRTSGFLAVTQAKIYDRDGKTLVYECAFVAVNTAGIEWVLPQSELKEHKAGEE
ncbi:MAG: hypothetical protein AB1522_01515 [Chloroflexota bacterium]